jgi:hypothetical protein
MREEDDAVDVVGEMNEFGMGEGTLANENVGRLWKPMP